MTAGVSQPQQPDLIERLQRVAERSPEVRRELASVSVRYFAKYYLDRDLWDCQERWITKVRKAKQGLILGPCGHGKTESMAKVLPLQEIVQNRNIRILIVAKSDKLAMKDLFSIRMELETNDRLIADYGRFYDRKFVWTKHQLYCIRPDQAMKDPTVEAVGIGGAITGGRFDIIILDDVIDVLSVREATQREKHREYLDTTLIPRLEPWGVIWAIGTRKHPDDIYNHMLKNPAWTCVVDRAIVREPLYETHKLDEPYTMIDPIGREVEITHEIRFKTDDHGECLAKDKWTVEKLLLLRHAIGTITFGREYQNIITSDENAIFKLQWLLQCRDENLSYVIGDLPGELRDRYLAIFQGDDPSLVPDPKKAKADDTDYMVIVTVGLSDDGDRYLLARRRERGLSPTEVQTAIRTEYYRFMPDFHFIEVNNFGVIHAYNATQSTSMKICRHNTGSNKHDLYQGLPSLAVLFENRKFHLPYKTAEDKKITDELIAEFYGFGTEAHDDQVMAIWIADYNMALYERARHRRKAPGGSSGSVRLV